MALDALWIALGSLLLVATIYDLFQSVLTPRPAVGRIRFSTDFVRVAWLGWRNVARRRKQLQAREAALAVFAPFMVVVLLVTWGFLFILGFALLYSGLHDGLRPQPGSFGATLYFSAGRLLAFGVGSTQSTSAVTEILSVFQAAAGFGLFALVVTLLFSLFGAFQRRETAVVALDALAGAPPTGVQLLEVCAKFHMPEQLATTFSTWQAWTAEVLESHLAYPILFFFRSSHDNEAWSNSFGAVMDAATLVLSTIEGGPQGPARLMFKIGDHFVEDVRSNLGIDPHPAASVERFEFDEAAARLERAGYALRDLDKAWEEFHRLRAGYGGWLNLVSRALEVPPAPWIGDRSYLPHRDGRSGGGIRARMSRIRPGTPAPAAPSNGSASAASEPEREAARR
ncbi:MAG: hypothetical protein JOZ75_09390 [Candidatus Dormibacteraeota bacterium]|nr:hypothetical protein [Candidatus Dormibacteraeota bacterium]